MSAEFAGATAIDTVPNFSEFRILEALLFDAPRGVRPLAEDPWNTDLNAYNVTVSIVSEDTNNWNAKAVWQSRTGTAAYHELGLQLWTFQQGVAVTTANYPINVGFGNDSDKIVVKEAGVVGGERSYIVPKAPSLARGHTNLRFIVFGVLYDNVGNPIKGRDRSAPVPLTGTGGTVATPTATSVGVPTMAPTSTIPTPVATATRPPATQSPAATNTPQPTSVFSTPTRTPTVLPTYTVTPVPTQIFEPGLVVPSNLQALADQPVWGAFRLTADSRELFKRFTLWSATEDAQGNMVGVTNVGSAVVSSNQEKAFVDVPVGPAIQLNKFYAFTAESSRDGKTFSAAAVSNVFIPAPNYFETQVTGEGIRVRWPRFSSKTQLLLYHVIYDAYATASRAELVSDGEVFLTGETEYLFSADALNLIPADDYFIAVAGWLGWDRRLPVNDQKTGVMSVAHYTPLTRYGNVRGLFSSLGIWKKVEASPFPPFPSQ